MYTMDVNKKEPPTYEKLRTTDKLNIGIMNALKKMKFWQIILSSHRAQSIKIIGFLKDFQTSWRHTRESPIVAPTDT